MWRASLKFSSSLSDNGVLSPGTQGTPAAIIAFLAEILSPMIRIVSALGPINTKPLFFTFSAKSAFSDKKP